MREAQSETEQQKRLASLFDLEKTARAQEKSIRKLKQMQLPSGGFPWFKGGRDNPYITRHILAGFGHLEKLGITSQRNKTDKMIGKMTAYLDRKIIEDFEYFKKHHKDSTHFYKRKALIHFAYARSFYKNRFPLDGKAKELVTKALEYQKQHWQTQSLYYKTLLVLCFCLLYTSPSPRDGATSRMPSSA